MLMPIAVIDSDNVVYIRVRLVLNVSSEVEVAEKDDPVEHDLTMNRGKKI